MRKPCYQCGTTDLSKSEILMAEIKDAKGKLEVGVKRIERQHPGSSSADNLRARIETYDHVLNLIGRLDQ